ncbi:MAG TPA: FAD synthetase family protein [Pseudogracilibacillus sp.]|nr:FAD synthetase family protein [Pseudogracilibacillus sp.]
MKTCFIKNKHSHYFQLHAEPCVLAIGFFDGVHVGHQKVIKRAVQQAKQMNMKAAVMTFLPHPKEVISRGKECVDMLTTFTQKERVIADLGVDLLYVVQFNKDFASIAPEQFVQEYLCALQVKHVVVGFDFTYGKFGKGNVFTLAKDGKGNFNVTVIEKLAYNEEKISSTAIRQKIRDGDIGMANLYLGREFETTGFVQFAEQNKLVINNIQHVLPETGYYEIIMKYKKILKRTIAYCNREDGELYVESDRTDRTLLHLRDNDQVTVIWQMNAEHLFVARTIYVRKPIDTFQWLDYSL